MKVADIITDFLVENGINVVFGYPGGNITHVLNSIYHNKEIQYVQNYHEQACAFSAVGYSKVHSRPSVALSSSGPGATNMITGIADAFLDSVPVFFITGQVNRNGHKTSPFQRQNEFQELGIVSLIQSITKYAITIQDEMEILYHLEKAYAVMMEGRRGPVLIDLPHDVQYSEVDQKKLRHYTPSNNTLFLDEDVVCRASKLLGKSHRPIVVVGGWMDRNQRNSFLRYIHEFRIPFACSMRALNQVDENDELFVGYIGNFGNVQANKCVLESDGILTLGCRLTGQHSSIFDDVVKRGTLVVQVDIDKEEFVYSSYDNVIGLNITVESFLLLQNNLKNEGVILSQPHESWMDHIREYKNGEEFNSISAFSSEDKTRIILRTVDSLIPENAVIVADVGQHLILCAQELSHGQDRFFLFSGGLGSMGFSLPAAIGACYSKPNSVVVSVIGDGGFQMNIQELQTVLKHKLPIKIIIINNHSLGMIRDYQHKWFDNDMGSVEEYLPVPDFEMICKGYGIEYVSIADEESVSKIKDKLNNNQPYVVEIVV